jgi:hypothetical protein
MWSTCIVNQLLGPYWVIYVKPTKKNIWTRIRFSRMSLWKTWSDVWVKMVVEEGLTRTWPWWTIHRIRASGSLGIEEPDVMEKGKWMFNLTNQASHEESHVSKCQSILNQVTWRSKVEIDLTCEVFQVTTSKSQCRSKIKCGNPHEVKKRWSGNHQYCASSSWRIVFYM